jgi:hypothetical protein
MQRVSTAAIASTASRRWTMAPRGARRTAPRMRARVAISTSPCGTIEVMVAAIIRTSSYSSMLPRR